MSNNFLASPNALSLADLQALAQQLPAKIPYLKMLVLFGSRARGNFHAESDWDFAALYDEDIRQKRIEQKLWNHFELPSLIREELGILDHKIDAIELSHRSSPLLTYSVARDGKLIYERDPGEFTSFRVKACKVYADTEKFRQSVRRCIELSLEKLGV